MTINIVSQYVLDGCVLVVACHICAYRSWRLSVVSGIALSGGGGLRLLGLGNLFGGGECRILIRFWKRWARRPPVFAVAAPGAGFVTLGAVPPSDLPGRFVRWCTATRCAFWILAAE